MKTFQVDRKVKVLCVIYFMVAQSSMMARATSDSFLLKYFEAGSIPLMIMAAASLSIVLALFTTYLCGRFQAFGAMKIATMGIVVTLLSMVCIVYFFGNEGETKPIYVFAYMLCETIVILPMVLFWGMAVGVLNPTESKKWMGFIGAAGTIGCILAGFTISIVSKHEYVNELSLGLVALVLLVVAIILIVRSEIFRLSDDEQKPVAGESNSVLKKLGVLISSRQSILMTWLVVFSAIVLSLIDINFKFEVRKDYSDDLYDFFGQFYTYTSCAQLILQLFIVRAILTRGGVWAAISILPILLLVTSIGALFLQDQNAVYVGKFITQVVFFTIEYVGLQMLFLSVKKKLRGQMNSAVDGLTRPATIAVISLLITYTLPFWQGSSETDSVWRLNSIIIILCSLWLFVSFLNYRQYLSSLLNLVGAKSERRISYRTSLVEKIKKMNLIRFILRLQNYAMVMLEKEFISLVNKALGLGNRDNIRSLEKFITQVDDSECRFDIVGKYFATLKEWELTPSDKSFVKKESLGLLGDILQIGEILGSTPKDKTFEPVSQSVGEVIDIRVQNLCDALQLIHGNINFTKLLGLIRSNQANIKAEAIEVLKGVVGSQKTDLLVTAIVQDQETDNSEIDVGAFLQRVKNHYSAKILESVILSFTSNLYTKNKTFLVGVLEHREVFLRDLAFKVLIKYEEDKEEIEKFRIMLKENPNI
jgi:hypothetical protein